MQRSTVSTLSRKWINIDLTFICGVIYNCIKLFLDCSEHSFNTHLANTMTLTICKRTVFHYVIVLSYWHGIGADIRFLENLVHRPISTTYN